MILEDNRTIPVYTELPQYINREISSLSHWGLKIAIR